MTTTTERNLLELEQIHQLKNATMTAQSRVDLQALIAALDKNAPLDTDPNALDDVIQTYKERFDRLKFLFYEEEAKERFMRLVLEQNDTEVDHELIENAEMERVEMKEALDVKEEETQRLVKVIEEKSKENQMMLDQIDLKSESISKTITSVEESKVQVDQLRAELSLKEKVDTSIDQLQSRSETLKTFGDYSLNDVQDVKKLLELVRSKRQSVRNKTLELEKLKTDQEDRIHRDRSRAQRLNSEKTRIQKAVESMRRLDGGDDASASEQKKRVLEMEEKVLLLLKIWPHYSCVEKIEVEDRVVSLVFKDAPQTEVSIRMKDETLIESVWFEGLSPDTAKSMVDESNNEITPIYALSKKIREMLSQTES